MILGTEGYGGIWVLSATAEMERAADVAQICVFYWLSESPISRTAFFDCGFSKAARKPLRKLDPERHFETRFVEITSRNRSAPDII